MRREEFWINFERQKKAKPKRPASKQLSAAHRKAISEGLKDYYDSVPKKQETIADKGEKVTKSIGRVARSLKTVSEAADIASSVYERLKKPETQRNVGAAAIAALGAFQTLSGSANNLGKATKNIASATNLIHDITSGSKKRRDSMKEEALKIKKETDRTNRQIHSIRARLERSRLKQKKDELGVKRSTAGSYRKLVDVAKESLNTKKQDSATRAAKQKIKRGDDYWFLD